MKRLLPLLLLTLFAATPQAHAETVTLNQNTALLAGPDKDYPVVENVGKGERVELRGCIENFTWCEVRTIENEYGWIRARYLRLERGGRNVTIIESKNDGGTRVTIFRYPDYWDRHYRGKYFYRNHGRWHGDKPERLSRPPVEKPGPKYKKMETPAKGKYNPLCKMGESDC